MLSTAICSCHHSTRQMGHDEFDHAKWLQHTNFSQCSTLAQGCDSVTYAGCHGCVCWCCRLRCPVCGMPCCHGCWMLRRGSEQQQQSMKHQQSKQCYEPQMVVMPAMMLMPAGALVVTTTWIHMLHIHQDTSCCQKILRLFLSLTAQAISACVQLIHL